MGSLRGVEVRHGNNDAFLATLKYVIKIAVNGQVILMLAIGGISNQDTSQL
jgi:hypothetical protein